MLCQNGDYYRRFNMDLPWGDFFITIPDYNDILEQEVYNPSYAILVAREGAGTGRYPLVVFPLFLSAGKKWAQATSMQLQGPMSLRHLRIFWTCRSGNENHRRWYSSTWYSTSCSGREMKIRSRLAADRQTVPPLYKYVQVQRVRRCQ